MPGMPTPPNLSQPDVFAVKNGGFVEVVDPDNHMIDF